MGSSPSTGQEEIEWCFHAHWRFHPGMYWECEECGMWASKEALIAGGRDDIRDVDWHRVTLYKQPPTPLRAGAS